VPSPAVQVSFGDSGKLQPGAGKRDSSPHAVPATERNSLACSGARVAAGNSLLLDLPAREGPENKFSPPAKSQISVTSLRREGKKDRAWGALPTLPLVVAAPIPEQGC
jgi:hypothetical protein